MGETLFSGCDGRPLLSECPPPRLLKSMQRVWEEWLRRGAKRGRKSLEDEFSKQ